MTILQAQIIASFLTVLWFKHLGIHRILLEFFGYPPYASKRDIKQFYLKPLGCYFCTSFWIGVLISLPLFYYSTLEETIYFILLNTTISGILDSILGYQSIKEK